MNTDDINLAYKLRHALNETLDTLPASTTDRLAAARAAAGGGARHGAPRFDLQASFSALFATPWAARTAAIIPLVAMVAGLVGVYQSEHEQRVAELADLDAAVLSDNLPLTAYIDHGFNAYLAQQQQQRPQRTQ
jgi:hypothetical protein